MRLISSARISAIAVTPLDFCSDRRALQFLAHPLQLCAQASVEHGGAHLRDHAAEDRRIGLRLEDDLAPGDAGYRLAQAVQVAVLERLRRGDGGADAADLLVEH